MKFWDSSAIVPLLVEQRHSKRVARLFQADPELVVWWGARVECVSAIARLERQGLIDGAAVSASLDRLKQLAVIWDEVQATQRLRSAAERLVRVHPLRAADALQLAAMVEVDVDGSRDLDVVCFDDHLTKAALREGFRVTAAE